jgi:hypothetical protein
LQSAEALTSAAKSAILVEKLLVSGCHQHDEVNSDPQHCEQGYSAEKDNDCFPKVLIPMIAVDDSRGGIPIGWLT